MTFSSIGALLTVPPVNLAALALLGAAIGRRWGRRLAIVATILLLALSLPVVADALLASLGQGVCDDACRQAGPPGAIIVLGAEVERDPSPAHEDAPGVLTLQRLRTGAAVARRTGLPVLVSGGAADAETTPVADVMARSLQTDFGVTPRWVEPNSATTWENARDSAPMLRAAGITTALVVTNAWHMRRALIAFAHSGLVAIPSPVLPVPGIRMDVGSFLPRASAWMTSYYAVHEWVGCLWYRLREGFAHG